MRAAKKEAPLQARPRRSSRCPPAPSRHQLLRTDSISLHGNAGVPAWQVSKSRPVEKHDNARVRVTGSIQLRAGRGRSTIELHVVGCGAGRVCARRERTRVREGQQAAPGLGGRSGGGGSSSASGRGDAARGRAAASTRSFGRVHRGSSAPGSLSCVVPARRWPAVPRRSSFVRHEQGSASKVIRNTAQLVGRAARASGEA